MPHCSTCPARDLPFACAATARPHPRFCHLSDPNHPDHNPDYAPLVRAWTEQDAAPPGTDNRKRSVTTAPYRSADEFLAPLRHARSPGAMLDRKPWRGCAPKHPADYEITACLIHLDTPGWLAGAVATLRAQTVRPYILVVDMGSLEESRSSLERMELEADDIEMVYLRPRGWVGTSQPVAAGMDVAWSLVQTEYSFATHVDCFLKRPDYLEWLLDRCDERTPAVGYQMSERKEGGGMWATTLSHTASLYHMPSMRKHGVRWSMIEAAEALGIDPGHQSAGWPDTETMVGIALRRSGVGVRWRETPTETPSVLMVGPEPNEPYETPWLVHERSATSHALYNPSFGMTRKDRVDRAAAEAIERAKGWVEDRRPKPVVPEPPASIFVADDALHARIVAGVEACPHRETVVACCGPRDRCGAKGRRPGQGADTATCYPCIRDAS